MGVWHYGDITDSTFGRLLNKPKWKMRRRHGNGNIWERDGHKSRKEYCNWSEMI